MNEVSYMLRIVVGRGRWTVKDLLDLVGPGFIDPGTCMTPITIHSLSKDEAEAIHSILTADYGAVIHQEVQRGSYRG